MLITKKYKNAFSAVVVFYSILITKDILNNAAKIDYIKERLVKFIIGSNLTFINQNTKALIWPIPGAGLLCNRVWRGLRTSNTPPMSSHHSAKVRILAEKSFLLFLIFTVNLATKKLLTICHVILIPYSNWVGSSNGQI